MKINTFILVFSGKEYLYTPPRIASILEFPSLYGSVHVNSL